MNRPASDTLDANAREQTPPASSRAAAVVRLLLRSPAFVIGALILLAWIVCALAGQWFAPYDAYASDPLSSLMPPDHAHWCGTDQLGRDICSRVIVGARDILTIAPLATLTGTLAGAALGLVTGYFEGWIGTLVSRALDAVLALPLVIVALLVLAAVGASNLAVVLVIGVTFAPLIARTVRAAVLAERHLDYVAAARLRGDRAPFVMFAEILPNVWPPIVVEATVRLGYAIFAVATLSFLGFGIQPPSADWGLALAESYALLAGGAWWTVAFDAAAIGSLVVAVNLIADSLREVLES
ncbi:MULTISPECIES: ABC transporter permease [Paraburkholderia]|uniref:Peptide/nickel transport system permease protein n=1 Tax=Paraburkholderia tropica TaxID=92647 RepID=A0A1A5X1D2_9BURK|nr:MULTISPECIES: ABC transporter permease [Paraburkholderia]MBB2979189.1 peptide/nickel transport system permease protein [Paraburkholderia tropica]MBB3002017.1 peptide/nickel transport system permease protein [Paraburkholderia tropica]MBB6321400.1 peptide/nickel transport system permease protein [Paraburkholderia tropica]MDE1143283.1 ABC transporter permease [Paraburkholderia tropica]OBR47267.1 peptide ABC transporter permease [Paraburkholderia tropica]